MAESEFARKTLPQQISQIRNDVNARMGSEDALRRLDAEVYGRVLAAAVHSVYGYIEYLARNLLPDQADEDWLPRHASLRQCPRKVAVAASGYARFDGVSNGLTVGIDSRFQGPDGQEYRVTTAVVSAGGLLLVPVECLVAGVSGNLDDGVDLQLISPIVGLSSIAQADTISGGADVETLEAWRVRVVATYALPPQGGSVADYKRWALEVSGVDRAWVFRALAGTGVVTVAVATSGQIDPTPAPALLSDVFDYIDLRRPAGSAGLLVVGPVLVPFSPSIRLVPDSPELRAAVTDGLREFLYREAELGGMTLQLSRISEAISLVAGERSHDLIAPVASVTYAALELPVLGTITWVT